MSFPPKGILRSPRYSTQVQNNPASSANINNPAPRQVRSLADLVKSSVDLNEEIRVSVVDEDETATRDNPILAPVNDGDDDDVTSTEAADESEQNDDSETVGSEDDEILMMLGLSDIRGEASDESDAETERGSFRKLWEMLMQWTTPRTTHLIFQCTNNQNHCQPELNVEMEAIESNRQFHDEHSRNTIDIGASKRAGIMNMVRMNISKSFSELKHTHNIVDRRNVEKQLADLVNTFDCSGPVADFDTKLWRGMTTVLMAVLFPLRSEYSYDATDLQLPKSIVDIGLLTDEYRYLTQRAFIDLNQN